MVYNFKNFVKRKTKKKQILLVDTKRKLDNYLNMLTYRLNGKYESIPHFVITKTGDIINLFDTNYYSKFLGDNFDKHRIIIAIENLGELSKNTITNTFQNYLLEKYRGKPFNYNWRNSAYWDSYTEEQFNSLCQLSKELIIKHKIKNVLSMNNNYFINSFNFNGIVFKSNLSNIYKDINPSFNFKGFYNFIHKTNE